MANHINTISLYQREPFRQGSITHQWIWFYEEGIPPELRIVHEETEKEFSRRASIQLLPQHYIKGSTESYVKQQLKKRENEYITNKSISLLICTWNAAGLAPKESIIPLFLSCGSKSAQINNHPDLLIVALQEMCQLKATNLLGDEHRKNEWLEFILVQANLAYPQAEYKPVINQHLVGLFSVVLASDRIISSIDKARDCSVKVGLRGYVGNKGAVSLRFELFNSSFCIINCHLTAHKGKVSKRNKNIKTILQETSFSIDGNYQKIYEHDYIFWAGDLNYRIANLKCEEIIEMLSRQKILELSEYDQLQNEKRKNSILADFQEGPLDFPPTFKVIKGSCDYK